MTLNFLISILVLFFFFLFKGKETLSPWWIYLGGPKTLLPTALTFHVCIKDSSFPSTHFTPSTCIYRHQQQFWISRDLTQSKARGGGGGGEREREGGRGKKEGGGGGGGGEKERERGSKLGWRRRVFPSDETFLGLQSGIVTKRKEV